MPSRRRGGPKRDQAFARAMQTSGERRDDWLAEGERLATAALARHIQAQGGGNANLGPANGAPSAEVLARYTDIPDAGLAPDGIPPAWAGYDPTTEGLHGK